MAGYTFVMAAGTFDDMAVEREQLAGRPVTLRVASLATPDEIERETAEADGIIVTTNPLPAAFIARFGPRMRIIGRAGIGLDAIDLQAAARRGVAVLHAPDYATQEVATHAVALILALNRRLAEGDAVARGRWTAWRELTPVAPLYEQTIGVVGCGRIGRAVIERLRPLAGAIVTYDPYVTSAPEGARLVASLDELLAQSDAVTLHPPLTEETRAMIGRRELALMKRGALLVNVARGALIDESALTEALQEGHVGAAALDVLHKEPPPPDAAIMRAPNVLLSPHFAWYSTASERRVRTTTVDGMWDYLEGQPPRAGRLAVVPESGAPS
jgi:D-3-phosphoglycerate dehydrogenase